MTTQPLFPKWFNPHRKAARPNSTKMFAIFPDGTESEIITRKSPVSGATKDFACGGPDGTKSENSRLCDLKRFLELDFPGTTFARRSN